MPESSHDYTFEGGYPTPETIQQAYDDADLNRAIQAYKYFYATVAGAAIFKGNADVGIFPNKTFGTMDTQPKHVGYTLNSDTPYGPILLDLSVGPIVIELPEGALIAAVLNFDQSWVADMGLPGPDAGKGGKHLVLPPGYAGEVPSGYYVGRAQSMRVIAGVRSLPVGGDLPSAFERLKTIKVYPLDPNASWSAPEWIDMTPKPNDTTPLAWEKTLDSWKELHWAIDSEPAIEVHRHAYGDLAVLGIEKGKPFAPDERMKGILETAARIANDQMRVQSLADRRPDRVVWPDRQWQWAALRFEDGSFNTQNYVDVYAFEKWFFQAIASSPAMFRRGAGAGSVYWLGSHDSSGAYLDGGKSYTLTIPQPVPAKLFWSVTVYDAETRSQIQTEQAKAALRSLFELKDVSKSEPTELYFGPTAPKGQEGQWIQTIPGKGWFVYFRIYGPEESAFDGSWKPGDFELVR
jgi:hypothetical protein